MSIKTKKKFHLVILLNLIKVNFLTVSKQQPLKNNQGTPSISKIRASKLRLGYELKVREEREKRERL